MSDDSTEPTLERRLARLEEILTAIEADELDLGDALKLFEEGIGHIRAAEETLASARLRVEEVLGADRTREFDEGDDGA